MSLRMRKTFLRSIVGVVERKEIPESKVKAFEEIPGPKPLPLVGNLWRYFPVVGKYSLDKIHHTYAKMYMEFGPLVREKVYSDRTLVHVFDPDDMMTVYKNEGSLPIRQSHRALARYREERPKTYDGPGLFPSNGEEWFRFRRLFQKILMAPSAGEICSEALEDVTEDLLGSISSEMDEKQEVDMQPLLFNWALECVGAITLNRRLGCLSVEGNEEAMGLVAAANNIHKSVCLTENSPFNYKKNYKILEEAQEYLESVVKRYVEKAIEDITIGRNKNSFLAKMLKDENITKKDVFTMTLDMFLAGIDTTAYTLAFTLYNLAINPPVQETLRAELMEHLPEKSTRVSDSRCRLRFLQLVIKETLRVNPVAIGTGRIIPSDLVLSGYKVPAKTLVILQHQVASMLDKHFPNARAFDPERWSTKSTPLVSSPFGYGPRMCIGMRIARKELQLVIARIIRSFRISYHYEPIDSCNKLINVPDKPVRLRFQTVD